MIEVKGISKAYGNGNNRFMVLDNVSFTIPDGASVAIVGKSGSGKSSLIQAMSGLAKPEFGEVIVNGHDILKLPQKQVDNFRARAMGFIFQSFFVQNYQTCAQNISLPLEILGIPIDQRDSMINEALRAVGLFDKKEVKGINLSGGQKQRLAIARAIVNRPRFLFADEPTGNLDSVTGQGIEELLFWCNKVNLSTLIMVTHDIELANRCDMQIVISDGKVASITQKGHAINATPTIMTKQNFSQLVQQSSATQVQQPTVTVVPQQPVSVPPAQQVVYTQPVPVAAPPQSSIPEVPIASPLPPTPSPIQPIPSTGETGYSKPIALQPTVPVPSPAPEPQSAPVFAPDVQQVAVVPVPQPVLQQSNLPQPIATVFAAAPKAAPGSKRQMIVKPLHDESQIIPPPRVTGVSKQTMITTSQSVVGGPMA